MDFTISKLLSLKSGFGALRPAILAVLMAGIVAGCASRPEGAPSIQTETPMEGVESTADHVLPPRTGGDDNVHTLLALSGGGANGAYGAGVIFGWMERGDRPEFDVVTGVSTGALLSVFAFLGKDFDDEMKEAYTTVKDDDIYLKRGLGGLFGQAVFDNTPLKRQIEKYVTEPVLDEVARQYDRGRRLYIATTNLDGGSSVIWDMGRIAKGGRTNRLQHFQKVLRASAAVPGVFDPVYIKPERGIQKRQAHVDGSVKIPVLVADFMFETKQKKRELYIVKNGTLTRYDTKPVKPNLISISAKSISELTRALDIETIFRDYIAARRFNAGFHLTAIPSDFPLEENPIIFNPKTMELLFEAGKKDGRAGPNSWLSMPPDLTPYEKGVAVQ